MKTVKQLSEDINDLLNIHAENTSDSEIYWDKQLGWDKKGSTAYNAEEDWKEALRSLLTDFVKEIETEVVDLKSEYPQRIWSKSLEDVELGIALDGLETFKREQRAKLNQILKDQKEEV